MRRSSLSTCIATALTLVVSLVGAGVAQAGVVTYQGTHYGVTMASGTLPASVSPVITSVPGCLTPSAGRAPFLPATGLCYHGGSVIHKNETFAFAWDPTEDKDYTAHYVEQFMRDVADGSGTLSSPFAVTQQYGDATGIAANDSRFGGGYDDQATPMPSDCTPSGTHLFSLGTNTYVSRPNDICLTDSDLRQEIAHLIKQNGLDNPANILPGYTPLFVLMTPPGVETCLDSAGQLCSANSDATQVTGQFCGYHSQLDVNGSAYDYVVQPFTAGTEAPGSGCDEPDTTAPPTSGSIDPHTLATAMGARLVNPLSQAEIAAIVNPDFHGWYADDGAEINDNGCVNLGVPLAAGLDQVMVGGTSYYLRREFNNGGMIVDDAFAYPCAPSVDLEPKFAVPSPVNAGDVVQFDGGHSPSTLVIAKYEWDFGDGGTATGPGVVHAYAHGGTYNVTLKVTDRGGYTETATQQVAVVGPPPPASPPASPASPPASPPASTPSISLPTGQPGPSSHAKPALQVRLALAPQGLKGILDSGVALNVTSNQSANAILTLSIPRSAAKRAHITAGRGPAVVIGRGTVSGIHSGSNPLHVHLSKTTASKLKRLGHVTLTIRLTLVASGGHRITVDAAGHY